jgi:hypothetical protein
LIRAGPLRAAPFCETRQSKASVVRNRNSTAPAPMFPLVQGPSLLGEIFPRDTRWAKSNGPRAQGLYRQTQSPRVGHLDKALPGSLKQRVWRFTCRGLRKPFYNRGSSWRASSEGTVERHCRCRDPCGKNERRRASRPPALAVFRRVGQVQHHCRRAMLRRKGRSLERACFLLWCSLSS